MLAIMTPAGLLSPVVDIASFLHELNVLDGRAGSTQGQLERYRLEGQEYEECAK